MLEKDNSAHVDNNQCATTVFACHLVSLFHKQVSGNALSSC